MTAGLTSAERDRQLLDLRAQGLSAPQIGEKLGLKENSVFVHLARLRKRGVAVHSSTAPSGRPVSKPLVISEGFRWTEEKIAVLRKMWLVDGLSCNRIAVELGAPSKGAVVGKLSRLGLQGRRAGSKPEVNRVTSTKVPETVDEVRARVLRIVPDKPARRRFVRTEQVADPPPPPVRKGCFEPGSRKTVAFEDLRLGQCRWPFGESPFRYCGDPTTSPHDPECPYCATHTALAFVASPTKPRTRTPAQAAYDASGGAWAAAQRRRASA